MRGGSKQGELLDLREIGNSLPAGRIMLPEIWQGLCPGWIKRGIAKETEHWGCVHHLLVRYKKQGHSVTVLVAQDN